MSASEYKLVELFGGAITAEFPSSFGDVRYDLFLLTSNRGCGEEKRKTRNKKKKRKEEKSRAEQNALPLRSEEIGKPRPSLLSPPTNTSSHAQLTRFFLPY